jgi:TonB family protein
MGEHMILLAIAALGASNMAPFGATLGLDAAAQQPLQPGEVHIRILPSPSDYPAAARKARVEGVAVAMCAVDGAGALRACRIQQEQPADYGFGQALLETAERVRIETVTLKGAPTVGRSFRLALRFRLPDQGQADGAGQ